MSRSPASASRRAGDPVTEDAPGWIRLLGPLTLETGRGSAMLGGLRQRAVLALLAIHAGEVLSQDALIEELWAGEPPSSAVSTLQGYVSHLRRALAGSPFELIRRGPGYALIGDPDRIDARAFAGLIGEAQRALTGGRAAAAVELLDAALAMWRGPALADFADEDFARPEANRLEEARLEALSLRVEADLVLGMHQGAASKLEQLVRDHPLREDFRAQLMRALAAGGRRVEALRVYEEGRRIFAEELGLDPSLTLQRLERAILAQDPSVEAPSVSSATPDRLPAPTTSFVGREDELAAVADLARQRRLVTITGPGGIGKTRLAIEAARTLAVEHTDGAFLVELADLGDPAQVGPAVAKVLGVQAAPDRPVWDAIEQALGHRSCLIIIDNCEHLLEASAMAASSLLRAGPNVRIITTSRQPLGVAGESVRALPPLHVVDGTADGAPDALMASEAVRLFVERADAAWPGFSVSEENAAAVARICQRLDGIPLAIELAAARLRTLTAEQLADRLDDRFSLLTTGDRSAPARYRTLQASVEWSYELLTVEEQALFRRLAVFAGSFDLGAAEAICSGGPVSVAGVVGGCGDLLDKSLLTRVKGPDGDPRYRMLETLRHFALVSLAASAEEVSLRAAHARVFTERALAAVARLHGPQTAVWVGQLDADRADIRSAFEWLAEAGEPSEALRLATGLWVYWRYRDEGAEGRAWLRRALARGSHDRGPRLDATVATARLALVDDDPEAAEAACAEGLDLAGPGDDWQRAHLLAVRAEVLRLQGTDPPAAERWAEEAVNGFHRLSDAYWEGHARRVLGQTAWDQGDLTRATTLAGQCLGLFEACGDAEGVAGARLMLAGMARDQGDTATAADLYEASLVAFRAIDQPWGQAEAARHYGTLVLAAGDDAKAEDLGTESLRLCEQLGLGRGLGHSYELLAKVAFERGRLDEARELCDRALAQLRSQGYPGDVATVASTAGHVALQQGDLPGAVELLQESIGPRHGFGYRRNPAMALSLLARARARLGDTSSAVLAQEALDLARNAGDGRATASSIEALAEAVLLQGHPEQAGRYLLVARYTRQAAGTPLSPVDRVDHAATVEAVRAALADGPFAEAWRTAWESDVIDITALETLAASPDAVLGTRPVAWSGPDRRGEERRSQDRRRSVEEVAVSASADRRSADRRRWQRRRSDRVP